jgi:hypothetical protein
MKLVILVALTKLLCTYYIDTVDEFYLITNQIEK